MFNKTTPKKKEQVVRNEAGGNAYKLKPTRALFAQLSSFKPKSSYYLSEADKLKILEDAMAQCDPKEAIALAHYAATELGMRLAPALVVARVVNERTLSDGTVLESVFKDVFVRPDMIANALGYLKHVNGGRSFLSGVDAHVTTNFRRVLESYKEHTLIRRKMLSREIKLKDLIKTLRPRPASPHMSQLYKQIIEDGPMSKLKVTKDENGKVKADHVTAVLSSTEVSEKDKAQYITENVGNIPIKALIANAKQIKDADIPNFARRIDDALLNGAKRYVNPLDMLQMATASNYGGWSSPFSPKVTKVFDDMVDKHFTLDAECNAPLIMFDVSGSMGTASQDMGNVLGVRYLALMRSLLEKPGMKFMAFDTGNRDLTREMQNLADVTPYAFMVQALRMLVPRGGTSLIQCTTEALAKGQHDALIIFTDEQSWFDTKDDDYYLPRLTSMINQYGLSGQTAIVNVCPSNTSVVANKAGVVRISGTNANILAALGPMFSWDKFVRSLVDKLFGTGQMA